MDIEPSAPDQTSDQPKSKRPTMPLLKVSLVAASLLAFGFVYARFRYPGLFADSGNYDLKYTEPTGWTRLPPKPLSIFRYKHDKYDVYLRGFQYQTISEVGPGDGMDANGLADYYTETTRTKQPGWTVQRLRDFKDGPVTFSMLRRTTKGKVVYTAFATKGNSTFGVTMYASGDQIPRMEALTSDLRKLLTSMILVPMQIVEKDIE